MGEDKDRIDDLYRGHVDEFVRELFGELRHHGARLDEISTTLKATHEQSAQNNQQLDQLAKRVRCIEYKILGVIALAGAALTVSLGLPMSSTIQAIAKLLGFG